MKETADDLQIDNLPNRLTIFRILLIPVVICCLLLSEALWKWIVPYHSALAWTAAACFAIASVTDYLDGYIARKRNIVTVFGSFLDPIADKFLVISSLIVLLSLGRVPVVVVIVLVLRELYMTSLRLLAMNEGLLVPVNQMGKWKTTIQMMSIPFLMIYNKWEGVPLGVIGMVLIYIAFILSLVSAISYSLTLVRKLKESRKLRKVAKKAASPTTT